MICSNSHKASTSSDRTWNRSERTVPKGMISSNHLNAILATVHKRANNHFVHLAGSVGKVAPSPKAAAYLDHSHRATAPLGLIESTGATNSELDQNEYEPLTHSMLLDLECADSQANMRPQIHCLRHSSSGSRLLAQDSTGLKLARYRTSIHPSTHPSI